MEMLCIGLLVMWCDVSDIKPRTPPPADTYCQIARPIYFSASDTRKTKEQADRENRKWRRLCGKP